VLCERFQCKWRHLLVSQKRIWCWTKFPAHSFNLKLKTLLTVFFSSVSSTFQFNNSRSKKMLIYVLYIITQILWRLLLSVLNLSETCDINKQIWDMQLYGETSNICKLIMLHFQCITTLNLKQQDSYICTLLSQWTPSCVHTQKEPQQCWVASRGATRLRYQMHSCHATKATTADQISTFHTY
jgi:hypothetical protein